MSNRSEKHRIKEALPLIWCALFYQAMKEGAEKAKDEMENLKSDNEKILNEAKLQRELLLKEAREIKSKIISDAENEATEKANKLIESAKTAIENEKSAAMKELKHTVVDLSLNIAEKLLSKELDNKEKQLENIQEILDKTKLN